MILYPTSIISRVAHTIMQAAAELRADRQIDRSNSIDLEKFEKIVVMQYWEKLEKRFPSG